MGGQNVGFALRNGSGNEEYDDAPFLTGGREFPGTLPYITGVTEGGAGADAGLQEGDRVVAIDGNSVVGLVPMDASKQIEDAMNNAFMTPCMGFKLHVLRPTA